MSLEPLAVLLPVVVNQLATNHHNPGRTSLMNDPKAVVKHIVRTYDADKLDRSAWECSCGRGGSAPSHMVDLASDRHIEAEGGLRVDRYPAR